MSNSWMPPKGRRNVVVGSSLTRALKTRKLKGEAPAPRSLHARDFYSFRYNFKPPSIDPGERGKIVVKKGKDSTSVTVERPSTQPGEAHVFVGGEHPAKEWECVLIYDDVSDTYTLEKLDSHMALTYERKMAVLERTASPVVPVPPAESSKRDLQYEEELERDLGAEEDADGEADDDFEEILPTSIARREEEEEEEEVLIPQPPPKPPRAIKAAAPPAVPIPAVKPRPAAAPPTRLKPVPMPRGKHRREPELITTYQRYSDADEENLEFGKPPKRARRPSPPPPPLSAGLALPSASSSIYTPPPPVILPSPPPAVVAAPVSESEEEEEWDEVAAVGKDVDTEDDFDIFGDALTGNVAGEVEGEGEDLDVNEFERELNLQMDEASDDDFLAAVVEEVPTIRGAPISLKELASGQAYASEDDYSSSDESDDD